jgi:hypothetical protein
MWNEISRMKRISYKKLVCEKQGGTKRAAVAAPLPGNFSEKTLLAGNFN